MPQLYARLHRRFGPRDGGITRREMLQRSVAAAAGVLLSEQFGALAQAGRRVIVVGAGFSGLTAAYELSQAGYDVTVVEARGRVGGRVVSLSRHRAGQERRGRRRADRIQSSDVGGVREAVQARLPRRHRREDAGRSRDPRRESADGEGSGAGLGRARRRSWRR